MRKVRSSHSVSSARSITVAAFAPPTAAARASPRPHNGLVGPRYNFAAATISSATPHTSTRIRSARSARSVKRTHFGVFPRSPENGKKFRILFWRRAFFCAAHRCCRMCCSEIIICSRSFLQSPSLILIVWSIFAQRFCGESIFSANFQLHSFRISDAALRSFHARREMHKTGSFGAVGGEAHMRNAVYVPAECMLWRSRRWKRELQRQQHRLTNNRPQNESSSAQMAAVALGKCSRVESSACVLVPSPGKCMRADVRDRH